MQITVLVLGDVDVSFCWRENYEMMQVKASRIYATFVYLSILTLQRRSENKILKCQSRY